MIIDTHVVVSSSNMKQIFQHCFLITCFIKNKILSISDSFNKFIRNTDSTPTFSDTTLNGIILIQMNSMSKSRIVSRTNSTPIPRFNCRTIIQNTTSNNTSRNNCRIISNLTSRNIYSQLNNQIIGQGPTLYPPNLPRLVKSGKNKLECIGCVGIPQDSTLGKR